MSLSWQFFNLLTTNPFLVFLGKGFYNQKSRNYSNLRDCVIYNLNSHFEQMRIKLIIVGILAVFFSSCIDQILGKRYVKMIKQSQRNFEDCYQVNGLYNHFPTSFSNQSVLNSKFSYPTKNFDPDIHYFIDGVLLLNMGENFKIFYPDTFIYKTNYSDSNFIVDGSFSYYQYYDTLKILNISKPKMYPIPFFENYDFGLDSVRFDLRDAGFLWLLIITMYPKI